MAGAEPLNGTSVGFAPTTALSSRQVKWVIEPTPACALLSFSELALSWARKPLRSSAGKSLRAMISTAWSTTRPIGAKSASGL